MSSNRGVTGRRGRGGAPRPQPAHSAGEARLPIGMSQRKAARDAKKRKDKADRRARRAAPNSPADRSRAPTVDEEEVEDSGDEVYEEDEEDLMIQHALAASLLEQEKGGSLQSSLPTTGAEDMTVVDDDASKDEDELLQQALMMSLQSGTDSPSHSQEPTIGESQTQDEEEPVAEGRSGESASADDRRERLNDLVARRRAASHGLSGGLSPMVAGQRRDRRRHVRRREQRRLRALEAEDEDYDGDDDSWIVYDDQSPDREMSIVQEVIRRSFTDLRGNNADDPIAVDDVELAQELDKQSRKYRKRIAREEIVISDDEDSRRPKEGRLSPADVRSEYDDEGEQLRKAISLSLRSGDTVASSSQGDDQRVAMGGGRLRTRRETRRELQEREKKRREAELEDQRQREALREEQNREFQESLLRDQVLERQREEEERLAKQASEMLEREAERKRREEEEKERDRSSLYEELKNKFERQDQQKANAGSSRREVALVLRMADGERIQRSFLADEPLEEVRQYATMKLLDKDRTANLNFVFVTDFPRRVLADFSRTLAENGLEQRTLLTVTDAGVVNQQP